MVVVGSGGWGGAFLLCVVTKDEKLNLFPFSLFLKKKKKKNFVYSLGKKIKIH